MKWISKTERGTKMVNLDSVDAFEYIVAEDFIKSQDPDHPAYNMFKMNGNYLKLYVHSSVVELHGKDADEVYNMLNTEEISTTMD